jgi:MoaA/NifB/PqqE/SkfB family radical SAM enzyme
MVSRSDIIEFVRKVTKYDDEYINLLGGEPFLHPDIIWQVEYLTGIYNQVRIVTNGTMLFKPIGKAFLERFIGNDRIYICVSDDSFHEQFWKGTFTAEKTRRLIESYDIRTEKDNRRQRVNQYYHIGRAVKNGIGDPDDPYIYCHDEEFRFEPCLLPNGNIASCCYAKCVVGQAGHDSIKSMEERFLKHMRKKVGSKIRCRTCKSRLK